MDVKEIKIEKSRQSRCRYCHPTFDPKHPTGHNCVVDGWEKGKVKSVSKEDCENCERFDSRYIEYPVTINGIENEKVDNTGLGHECGCLCEIKPCGDEHEGKSYIGFYLGDLPIAIHSSLSPETGILTNRTMNNPAIFVPELKKIVYGCESWWREINSIEDFKGITDDEINDTWYVKLLTMMTNNEQGD